MEISCTLAQLNPTTGDIEGNTGLIVDGIERATAAGADLVVFPELAITGYCVMDLVEDDTFVGANLSALDRVRAHTGETAAVVGFVDRDREGRYNAAAVLQHGEVRGVARKVLLPDYRYFDDDRYFEPGGPVSPIPIDTDAGTVELGVAVCEDMWDAGYDRRPIPALARAGADLIASVNASPFEAGKRRVRHETIRRHVDETGLPFLYANTVGAADVGRNVVVFDGDSLAYGGEGSLLARGTKFAEDHVDVTVGVGEGRGAFRGVAVGGDRAPVEVSREREVYEALVLAVRDYARKTGFERVIEPLSGGIDSCLGLAICADALGPRNVLALAMPSVATSAAAREVTERIAENVGADYRVVPVQSIVDEVVSVYESHVGPIRTGTARENVHARVRGLLAMLASNDSRAGSPAMVISNGNETEMALGYVTLYGDMAGGLDLLGDVPKTDVYALARYANERHGRELIPEAAFSLPPSAELAPGQVDPVDYQVVSPVVDDLLEGRLAPSELVASFRARELDPGRYGVDGGGRTVYDRYDDESFAALVYDTYERFSASAFERVQSPPVVAVSARAFGADFREPIINAWDGRPPEWARSTVSVREPAPSRPGLALGRGGRRYTSRSSSGTCCWVP